MANFNKIYVNLRKLVSYLYKEKTT